MARFASPSGVGIHLTSSNSTKADKISEKKPRVMSGAATGIVFGLLCSAIAWLLLAYGIYRLHELATVAR
ncbi:hypothetical protein [Granulicella sp. S190]|uniref:hypothetical protein n=1 Tax=Granulicella sp. S190 TaxID=1747226 RepID=UPI00131DFDA9|nr:hypothetical protein [Granulicella sp. S190]